MLEIEVYSPTKRNLSSLQIELIFRTKHFLWFRSTREWWPGKQTLSPKDETTGPSELKKADFGRNFAFTSTIIQNLHKETVYFIRASICYLLAGNSRNMGGSTIPKMVFLLSDDTTSNLRFASLRLRRTPHATITWASPSLMSFIEVDGLRKILQKVTSQPMAVDFHRGSSIYTLLVN